MAVFSLVRGQRGSIGPAAGGYNPFYPRPIRRSPVTPEELARQAKQHLDSLRAAGVEWLPDAPPPVIAFATSAPPQATTSLPVLPESRPASRTLFGGDEPPSPGASLTLEQRKEALAALAQQVAQCTRCAGLASTRT